MERYTMFLDWETPSCENDCTTQINLQTQCTPYQITSCTFHRNRTKAFIIGIETQNTSIAKVILSKQKFSFTLEDNCFTVLLLIASALQKHELTVSIHISPPS